MGRSEWYKYIATFVITALLFGTVFYVTKSVNDRRVREIRSIQDQIAIDLLSSETQFALLERAVCSTGSQTVLAPELGQLGERLAFTEGQLGAENQDVVGLKKYYSLLEIKDYLLTLKIADQCGLKTNTILYFYGKECDDCERQGYVLTELREQYPDLRVYSFDYDLDLSALKTLQTIYKIDATLPALVINEKKHAGFKSVADVEKLLPGLKKK